MTRKEFLASLGIGAVVLACDACLTGCQSNPVVPAPPPNVDFTLDLTDPANAALKAVGGYLYKSQLIVAHISGGSYVALSQICTHAGNNVYYDLPSNLFHCPAHGSNFNTDGAVVNGPAGSALRKYNSTLTGNSLHVFS